MQTIIVNKSRKFGKEILSHFREITLFVGDIFLSAPCIKVCERLVPVRGCYTRTTAATCRSSVQCINHCSACHNRSCEYEAYNSPHSVCLVQPARSILDIRYIRCRPPGAIQLTALYERQLHCAHSIDYWLYRKKLQSLRSLTPRRSL